MSTIDTIAIALCAVFCLLAMPFVLEHIAETWDAEEYPHSGFCPDFPTWEGGAR